MGNISREQLGEWLSAYLDDEVNEEQRALIEQLLREDDSARRMYEELRRTVELVSSLPRHDAPASIAEDVQAFSERSELIGDLDAPSPGVGRKRSPLVPLLSMAATLALVATGVWYASELAGTPTHTDQTVAVATKPKDDVALSERSEPRRSRRAAKLKPSAPATILASATFEQKLQSGMNVETVRAHRFENETVRLQVTVGSDVERDIVAAKLVGHLKKQAAADLSRHDPAIAAVKPAGRFYFEGSREVNFAEAGQRQVLVRASRADLEELMEEMSRATTGKKEFALASGPMSVRGFSRTQAMITGLEESAVATEGSGSFDADELGAVADAAAETPMSGADKAEGEATSFDGLLRAVGLDAAEFKRTFATAAKRKEAGPTTVANGPVALAPQETIAEIEPSSSGTTSLVGPAPPVELDASSAEIAIVAAADSKDTVVTSIASPPSAIGLADANADVAKSDTAAVPDSLVSRGMRALQKGRRESEPADVSALDDRAGDSEWRVDKTTTASRGRGARTATSSPDAYVTLVIQVMIDKPKAAKPGSQPAKPAVGPSETSPK